jgi:zinc/manganese transport system permease protein
VSWYHALLAPGLFTNPSVQEAAAVAALVAAVCGPVGMFTVMRSQSFAGHALADISSTGGSGALLLGLSPLVGFVVFGVAASGTMEMVGTHRRQGRDLVTGIVLGASLGLSALFLYLTTTSQTTTGAAVTVLFGSIFAVSSSTVWFALGVGAAALTVVGLLYRPLLLSSVDPELAAAQGIPVRLVGLAYMAALALAVALSALTIGAILSTALLIGPAAAALYLTRSPGRAMALASSIGLVVTWIGVALAYDSYEWLASHQGWPVSFFVVSLVLVTYAVARLWAGRRAGPNGRGAWPVGVGVRGRR